MELSYENADALVRTIGGTSAEHLGAFVGSLIGKQYSVSYVCQLARHALAFGRWCEARNISLHALSEDDIVRYQRARRQRRSRCLETRRRELHVLGLLLHFIPIHSSTCAVLAGYLRRREEFFDHPVSSYVFVTRYGNRLDIGHVHRTFYALSRHTGLRAVGASKGPRLHDFRHCFAVQTLTRWYQSGEDAWRLLPVLSAYLGHVYVAGTYWYLSDRPELMAQAMKRLERRWGESS